MSDKPSSNSHSKSGHSISHSRSNSDYSRRSSSRHHSHSRSGRSYSSNHHIVILPTPAHVVVTIPVAPATGSVFPKYS